jgi:hypothetical protein
VAFLILLPLGNPWTRMVHLYNRPISVTDQKRRSQYLVVYFTCDLFLGKGLPALLISMPAQINWRTRCQPELSRVRDRLYPRLLLLRCFDQRPRRYSCASSVMVSSIFTLTSPFASQVYSS